VTTIIVITPPPPKKDPPSPDGFAQLVAMPFEEARQAIARAEADGGTVRIVEA
jgi:hypothetical protein